MINAYNLSYIYMITENYTKVNKYVELCLQHGIPDNGIYFHNAYSYFKLRKLSSCIYWIGEGKSNLKKNENKMAELYKYLEYRINKDIDNSIKTLVDIIECTEYDPSFDNQDRQFVIKELLETCSLAKKFDLLAEYYSKYL